MKSRLLINKSVPLSKAEMLDLYLLEVDKDSSYPEGIKYAINYRVKEERKWRVVIRMDNKEAQGHHMHYNGKVEKFGFISFEVSKNCVLKLIRDKK